MTAIHRSAYRDHRDPVRTLEQALRDKALAQAERLRGRTLDVLEDTESVRKTQPHSDLLDDFSKDLDRALAALVCKINEEN